MKNSKISTVWLYVFIGFVVVAILGALLLGNPAEQAAPQKNATSSVKPAPAKVNYVYDVPSLLGKNIDELRQILGQPSTPSAYLEPTKAQKDLGVEAWDNTFTKNGQPLLATFNPNTREVIDLFISTDDPSGVTKNKDKLLTVGNLKESSSTYSVNFVGQFNDPSVYTGVTIKQK